MEPLLQLLKDGKSRTFEMLAEELCMNVEHVKRNIDYLERMGVIKRVALFDSESKNCSCSGCSRGKTTRACNGCMPKGGFKNMGSIWEVVKP